MLAYICVHLFSEIGKGMWLCQLMSLVSQSCLTLWYPIDCSHQAPLSLRILQARILEWVTVPCSRGSFQPRDQTQISHIAGRFFLYEPPGKPKVGINSYKIIKAYIHIYTLMIEKHTCWYLNSWITKNPSVKDTTLISQHGDLGHLYENIFKNI